MRPYRGHPLPPDAASHSKRQPTVEIIDNTDAPNDSGLSAEIMSIGSEARKPIDILPEHQHHADAVLAMDPSEVPMPYSIPEGWGMNLKLRIEALPEDMQRDVNARLRALGEMSPEDRSAREQQFCADAIRANRSKLITQIGVGADALPYHREAAAIAREVSSLIREHEGLFQTLEGSVRYETQTDPLTGEKVPVETYGLSPGRVRGIQMQQADIGRRIRLLVNEDGSHGIEGARRMREALAESVAVRVELERQITEEAEAKRRAEEINREKRINARAESLASLRRNGG